MRPLLYSLSFLRKLSPVTEGLGKGAVGISRSRHHICMFGSQSVVHQNEYIRGFEDIPELQSAPETVKRIFRLSNANQYEHRKIGQQEIKAKFDNKAEREIAELTQRINILTKHCEEKTKDKHNKVLLQWITDQRNKKLRHMKNAKFDRYLALIKELNIPPLESPHSKWNKYKFRKFKLGVEVKEKRSFLDRKIIT